MPAPGSDHGGRLRILLVSANFRPSVGGIERYTEILAQGLAGRGHEVTVLCCRSEGAPLAEDAGGVRVARVPASGFLRRSVGLPYPLPEPTALARALRGLVPGCDVVNAQDALYLTSVAALAVARRHRVPSVLTQHVAFVPQQSRALDALQHVAIRTLGRSARLATRVVAYNPAVADWARARWGLGDVPVLPPGVPDPPAVDRDELRRSLGLPADRFVALFVGRDVPTKSLDLFLAARDPALELVAVTDRPPGPDEDGVRLLPFMAPERLQALLASADAFVLASRSEGLPLSLQEALVSGLPCVVPRLPGFERYLRDDEVVFVERTPDAIRGALVRLAAHPDERSALAARARDAGRREFGVDAFVDAYAELYAGLVASRG